jgi:hypothetical protein
MNPKIPFFFGILFNNNNNSLRVITLNFFSQFNKISHPKNCWKESLRYVDVKKKFICMKKMQLSKDI